LALVIGNSEYQESLLKNSFDNAQDIKLCLEKLGFDVQLEINIGYNETKTILNSFVSNLNGGDTVFFYYSGYGAYLEGGYYLLPVNFKAGDCTNGSICLNRLLTDVELKECKNTFLYLMPVLIFLFYVNVLIVE
jgi:hypothetical protein